MSYVRVFYFGCWSPDRKGHFLHNRHGRSADAKALGFDEWIFDGTFAPKDPHETEGRAKLWHIPGWTILAYWDRSGDERGKSNSLFLIEAAWMEFEQALDVAQAAFPSIFARRRFPMTRC